MLHYSNSVRPESAASPPKEGEERGPQEGHKKRKRGERGEKGQGAVLWVRGAQRDESSQAGQTIKRQPDKQGQPPPAQETTGGGEGTWERGGGKPNFLLHGFVPLTFVPTALVAAGI